MAQIQVPVTIARRKLLLLLTRLLNMAALGSGTGLGSGFDLGKAMRQTRFTKLIISMTKLHRIVHERYEGAISQSLIQLQLEHASQSGVHKVSKVRVKE